MNIEPEKRAELVAKASVRYENNRLVEQKKKLEDQTNALEELRKTLTGFRSSIKALNSFDGGILKNRVTVSKDDVANITSTGRAVKGAYELEVTQLAKNHKIRYAALTDAEVAAATGRLTLGVDNKNFEIDLDKVKTLNELAHAINIHADNKGVAAAIYRIDGQEQLVLSSRETGAANTIKFGAGSSLLDPTSGEVSAAQDAIVKLDDIDITSPSNRLTTLPGVSIELKKITTGSDKLHFSVSPDEAGTEEQAQKFVEAYNTLKSSLTSLMVSGSKEKGIARGVFAGDANIRNIDEQLYRTLYSQFDGKTLSQLGIETLRDGTLSIKSETLKASLKNDPGALTNLFNGSNGLIKGMEEVLKPYVQSGGTLKVRQEEQDTQRRDLNIRQETLQTRLDEKYQRYLKIFTDVQATMDKMKSNTNNLFASLLNSQTTFNR